MATLSREEAEAARLYPRGSVGAAFQSYIRTREWCGLAPSSRMKVWWPAWFRIRAMWGDVDPNSISFRDDVRMARELEKTHGRGVAHKTIKTWRALWTVMRGMKIARGDDPTFGVRNKAPQPRSERWSEGEAVRLPKALGGPGTSDWRASSPSRGIPHFARRRADAARPPPEEQQRRDDFRPRWKDGRRRDAPLSARSATDRAAGVNLSCRPRCRAAPRRVSVSHALGGALSGSHLAHDFAEVREIVFPGDHRRLMDMRRSRRGRSDRAEPARPGSFPQRWRTRSSRSNVLHKTYSPVDLASVRSAGAARLRGRRRMRDENE